MVNENQLLITALADNELNQVDEKKARDLIGKDPGLELEYYIQTMMKSLVREKVKFVTTPEKVREKVLNTTIGNKGKVKERFSLANLFLRPKLAFGTLGAIILAIILIIFNIPPKVNDVEFSLNQVGPDNMFVQAKNNFKDIVEGKLKPQLVADDASAIDKFFHESGVKYSTLVPRYNEYNLLGAVVSEDKGEKFAHHVYTGSGGELIYFFQVDESYLYKSEIIKLSEELISFLDKGNCYETTEDNVSILMTKAENNIVAVVSNISSAKLKNDFCQIN